MGSNVSTTLAKGIADPSGLSAKAFAIVMTACLLGSFVWVTFATYKALPVSSTHAIVGAVTAGIIAAGQIEVRGD